MMIPMVLGSMGMKRIVVQVVNRFGYRRVRVIPARQGAKHKQQADRRQPQSAGDQHPTVAEAVVFLQIGLGFSPFHAGLMMIPMVLGSMGMKRIVVQYQPARAQNINSRLTAASPRVLATSTRR
jgi:hypothetical protein